MQNNYNNREPNWDRLAIILESKSTEDLRAMAIESRFQEMMGEAPEAVSAGDQESMRQVVDNIYRTYSREELLDEVEDFAIGLSAFDAEANVVMLDTKGTNRIDLNMEPSIVGEAARKELEDELKRLDFELTGNNPGALAVHYRSMQQKLDNPTALIKEPWEMSDGTKVHIGMGFKLLDVEVPEGADRDAVMSAVSDSMERIRKSAHLSVEMMQVSTPQSSLGIH